MEEKAERELKELIALSDKYSKEALLAFAGWILLKYDRDGTKA